MLRYTMSAGVAVVLGLVLAAPAGAVQTSYTNSSAVCQPDGNHADFDFTTQGKLRNTASAARHVACNVPAPTGLEGSYSVTVHFADGSQGSNCQLRVYDQGGVSTLMSDSGTWSGGNSPLSLGVNGFSATFKVAQLRCELVPGGAIVTVSSSTQ